MVVAMSINLARDCNRYLMCNSIVNTMQNPQRRASRAFAIDTGKWLQI
jgi:hypothetical protein